MNKEQAMAFLDKVPDITSVPELIGNMAYLIQSKTLSGENIESNEEWLGMALLSNAANVWVDSGEGKSVLDCFKEARERMKEKMRKDKSITCNCPKCTKLRENEMKNPTNEVLH